MYPVPDYATAQAWLALPGPASVMNAVPPQSGLSNLEDSAGVDVFYVLPTTGNLPQSAGPTDPYDDPVAYNFAVKAGLAQATPFNGTARIYAPLYRGVNNWVWGSNLAAAQVPLDLAYSDVKRAFDYYMTHYNNGRPVILAGHSQGDVHPMRLLYEEFDGKPLARRLVAAYLMGQPVNAAFFEGYSQIKACQSATDTSCQITWSSFSAAVSTAELDRWAADQYYWLPSLHAWAEPLPPFYPSMNPLTWNYQTAAVPGSANLGEEQFHLSYPVAAGSQMLEPLVVPGTAGAQSIAGALLIAPTPSTADFSVLIGGQEQLAGNVFHTIDFPLFYMNIRQNVRDRTNAYLQNNGAAYPLVSGAIVATTSTGAPFRFQVTTVNPATSFQASGLPAGLTIDPAVGTISGTPSGAGAYAVRLTVANAQGSSTGELALLVR